LKSDNDLPELNFIQTDLSESRMGHGVLFYYEVAGERLPFAFLDGFEWLHKMPRSADVLLFEIDAANFAGAGMDH